MPAISLSQLSRKVRELVRDPLYRGSLLLLANTGVLAGFGFIFWTLAARVYPEATVGSFSAFTSGIGLASAIAGLGLPNMVTRHVSSASSPLGLMAVVLAAITAIGGALSVTVLLGLGPHLPASLNLRQHGDTVLLFTALVVITALSGAIDAALIAVRATQALLWSNLAGAVARIAGLLLLTSLRSSGLVIAYSVGLSLATGLTVGPLLVRLRGAIRLGDALALFREYMAGNVQNYLATVLGMLPSTVVVLEVIARLGAARTAPFATASLVDGFLAVIPSTTSQVLFAEASRKGVTLGGQLRKALRAIYGLLLPVAGIVVLGAPLIMRVFGASYAAQAGNCLRILALSSLLTGGTYLVDSMLIARDRTGAYLFMNGANAALILGFVEFMLRDGINGAAEGWALGQGASLLLGLTVVVTGTTGRHRRAGARQPGTAHGAGETMPYGPASEPRQRIPDLTAARTTIPLMLSTATGAQESLRAVSERMARRAVTERPSQLTARPGEMVYCGIWFPPLSLRVAPRRVLTSRQLPVLTVVSAYSGWIAADLLPSIQPPDVHAGCRRALRQVGGVPRYMTWTTGRPAPAWTQFCASLGSEAIAAGEQARRCMDEVQWYIERSFLADRDISSPEQFRAQLREWLEIDNRLPGPGDDRPPAVLALADRKELRQLPDDRPGRR